MSRPTCERVGGSPPPWESVGALPALTTRLVAHGNLQSFSALQNEERRLPASWLPLPMSASADIESHWAPRSAWRHVAKAVGAGRPLRVSVLGTSPTSGCGAAEPWEPWALVPGPDGNLTLPAREQGCLVERSWGRRLQDELTAVLRAAAVDARVHTRLSFKNAVAADYFAHCTGTHVANGTDVVLLEVATNIWGSNLLDVVRAVQAFAPHAPIVFVGWVRKTHRQRLAVPPELEAAARTGRADLVRVGRVVDELDRARRLAKGRNEAYAGRGADPVHPSAKGHALLAAAVASFVGRRLLTALCPSPSAAAADADDADIPVEASSAAPPLGWELCWIRAEDIPLVRPLSSRANGTWAIVDDGGAKGIAKRGLASWAVGEVIKLGPLPAPAGAAAAAMLVELGYLISASRSGQGAFRVSCTGCLCNGYATPYSDKQYPFPLVQTDAHFAADANFLLLNASVTAKTAFVVWWRVETPCAIMVRHVRSSGSYARSARRRNVPPDPSVEDASRIRLDSLFARLFTATELQRQAQKAGAAFAQFAREPGLVVRGAGTGLEPSLGYNRSRIPVMAFSQGDVRSSPMAYPGVRPLPKLPPATSTARDADYLLGADYVFGVPSG